MQILVVAELFPWPPTGGGLMRLADWIEALAGMGEVDLFTLCDPLLPREVPSTISLARLETTPRPTRGPSLRWRAHWLTHRGIPMRVAMTSASDTPRRTFESWASDRYDLVLFSTAELFHQMGRPDLGPTIVDLVDLESEKEKQRARNIRDAASGPGVMAGLRRRIASAQSEMDARHWDRLQHSVAGQVDRVAVCSRLDAERSGLGNAAVVPNSFPRPGRPVGRPEVGKPPVVLFQGTLNYQPNVDAAAWLVADLAPRIRSTVPDVEVRLVGRTVPRVDRMDDPPAVTVVGRIPDMGPELARADLAVVPVRVGSGSRLKILESFAHRIPVVSTTIGADGLDVTDGVHLLVADDPAEFADACHRLLTDVGLRRRLADAGEDLFLRRYEWAAAKGRIQALAREVASPGPVR